MKTQLLEKIISDEPPADGREQDAGSENAGRIRRTIAYMAQHLNEPLQVSTLAAQASVSTSHYFALFKRQTGVAPIDYFIRLRMNHARELLDSTRQSIKEIAAEMGYDDPFYFSRVFKSVHQVAPAEYRRRSSLTKTGQLENGHRSMQPLAFAAAPNLTKQPRMTF